MVEPDENPDPYFSAALYTARHRAPRGLDLTGGNTSPRHGLQAVLAKADFVAVHSQTAIAPFLLLAKFCPFRL